MTLNELKNLNNLNKAIHKKWIWDNPNDFSKSCDYLQKINYSIQDLNSEIECLNNPSMKDIIYVIVLVDWIQEAFEAIMELLQNDIAKNFVYRNENKLKTAKEYFKALRSYAVAHPLTTNRHKKFGFNGDFICIDIQKNVSMIYSFTRKSEWYHIDFNGIQSNAKECKYDFILKSYSKVDNMEFYKYISVCFSDIYRVAELYIDKLYCLATFLSKQRSFDYKIGKK